MLSYSTYLGGPNADWAFDIAVDNFGAAYITGEAYSGFPLKNPAKTYGGGGDAIVAKLSPDGQTLVYATYLGGSYEEVAYGIAVDAKGRAYITGYTESGNFPTTPGAFQTTHGHFCGGYCANAFVTKLSADGGSLVYSTYLGVGGAESADAIAVDDAGNAYIKGQTNSEYYYTLNAVQPVYGGAEDAFVTKLNAAGSALVYSTYLGGNREEAFFYGGGGSIAVDPAGHAYVTGYTESLDFPTYNALQDNLKGNVDVYVTKLSPDGSSFVYSTYLGGEAGQIGHGIATDAAGNAYVTGATASDDFPITHGSFQPAMKGQNDAFVSKIKPDGSALAYSTFLGGNSYESGAAIATDEAGNAYVGGLTYSTNFPTRNAFQPSYAGGETDAFVTKFAPGGNALVYSSYLGGSGVDGGARIGLDKFGNAYLAGPTLSIDFPTVKPLQDHNAGSIDAFITKVSRFSREPVTHMPR